MRSTIVHRLFEAADALAIRPGWHTGHGVARICSRTCPHAKDKPTVGDVVDSQRLFGDQSRIAVNDVRNQRANSDLLRGCGHGGKQRPGLHPGGLNIERVHEVIKHPQRVVAQALDQSGALTYDCPCW